MEAQIQAIRSYLETNVPIAIDAASAAAKAAISAGAEAAEHAYAVTSSTAARVAAHAGPLASSLLRPVAEALEAGSRAGAASAAEWSAATARDLRVAVPALWKALQTADPLTLPKAAFVRAHAPALGVVFVCLIFAAYVVSAVCGRRSSKPVADAD
jgi:hypothetical protein